MLLDKKIAISTFCPLRFWATTPVMRSSHADVFPKGGEAAASGLWLMHRTKCWPLGFTRSELAGRQAKADGVPSWTWVTTPLSLRREVKLTGKKLEQKMYYRYSGYPGGMSPFRSTT